MTRRRTGPIISSRPSASPTNPGTQIITPPTSTSNPSDDKGPASAYDEQKEQRPEQADLVRHRHERGDLRGNDEQQADKEHIAGYRFRHSRREDDSSA
jgi:hypothetical protein